MTETTTLFFTIKIKGLCSPLHMLTSLSQTNYQPIFDNEQSYNHKIGRDLERAYGSPSQLSSSCTEIILGSNSLLFFFDVFKANDPQSLSSSYLSSNLLDYALFIGFLLFPVSFPTPVLMFPGISSQKTACAQILISGSTLRELS